MLYEQMHCDNTVPHAPGKSTWHQTHSFHLNVGNDLYRFMCFKVQTHQRNHQPSSIIINSMPAGASVISQRDFTMGLDQ